MFMTVSVYYKLKGTLGKCRETLLLLLSFTVMAIEKIF